MIPQKFGFLGLTLFLFIHSLDVYRIWSDAEYLNIFFIVAYSTLISNQLLYFVVSCSLISCFDCCVHSAAWRLALTTLLPPPFHHNNHLCVRHLTRKLLVDVWCGWLITGRSDSWCRSVTFVINRSNKLNVPNTVLKVDRFVCIQGSLTAVRILCGIVPGFKISYYL